MARLRERKETEEEKEKEKGGDFSHQTKRKQQIFEMTTINKTKLFHKKGIKKKKVV